MIEDRKDSYHLLQQLGLTEVWNEVAEDQFTSFVEGDFKEFCRKNNRL